MSDVHRVGRGLAPAVKNVGVWKGKMSLCFKDYSRFILQNVFVIRRREQALALHGAHRLCKRSLTDKSKFEVYKKEVSQEIRNHSYS